MDAAERLARDRGIATLGITAALFGSWLSSYTGGAAMYLTAGAHARASGRCARDAGHRGRRPDHLAYQASRHLGPQPHLSGTSGRTRPSHLAGIDSAICRIGTIGRYEAGHRRGPRRGRQIDPRRPPGRNYPPAADRTGQALLAAGPGPDAAGAVGSHPAPARRAGIMDHGRGPRTLRRPGYPA